MMSKEEKSAKRMFELYNPGFDHTGIKMDQDCIINIIMNYVAQGINGALKMNVFDYSDIMTTDFYEYGNYEHWDYDTDSINQFNSKVTEETTRNLVRVKSDELIEKIEEDLKRYIKDYINSPKVKSIISKLSKINVETAITNGLNEQEVLNDYTMLIKTDINSDDYFGFAGNSIFELNFASCGFEYDEEFRLKLYSLDIRDRTTFLKKIYFYIATNVMYQTATDLYYYTLGYIRDQIAKLPVDKSKPIDLVTYSQDYINNVLSANAYQPQTPVQPQFIPQPMMPPIQPQEPIINVPVTPSQAIHVEPTSNNILEVELTPEQKYKVQKVMQKYNLDNSNQDVVRCFVQNMLRA
jgi:hypothetical protein